MPPVVARLGLLFVAMGILFVAFLITADPVASPNPNAPAGLFQ